MLDDESIENALQSYMTEQHLTKAAATRKILADWLTDHHYVEQPASGHVKPGEPDPQEVQYPGYLKGSGSL